MASRPHKKSGTLKYQVNGRIPIFAVSASLAESQREELLDYGIDGWILKPIDFHRLHTVLKGVIDPVQRRHDVYRPGCDWEVGGWLREWNNLDGAARSPSQPSVPVAAFLRSIVEASA